MSGIEGIENNPFVGYGMGVRAGCSELRGGSHWLSHDEAHAVQCVPNACCAGMPDAGTALTEDIRVFSRASGDAATACLQKKSNRGNPIESSAQGGLVVCYNPVYALRG